METPASLPERVYLLSRDGGRRRAAHSLGELGHVLRAAALAELFVAGQLADVDGKVRVVGQPSTAEPILGEVLERIAASRPRSWEHWVHAGARGMPAAVRDQLAAGRWVRVEPVRILGLIPSARVSVSDPRVLQRLLAQVSAALSATRPASRVEPRVAALVAVAAAGDLRLGLSRAQRRAAKARIAELTDRGGPAAPALRRVLSRRRAATFASG